MLFNFEQTLSIPCHFSTYFVFIIIFWKLITDIRFDVRQVHFKPFSRVTECERGLHLDPAEDSMPTAGRMLIASQVYGPKDLFGQFWSTNCNSKTSAIIGQEDIPVIAP